MQTIAMKYHVCLLQVLDKWTATVPGVHSSDCEDDDEYSQSNCTSYFICIDVYFLA
jgi:hypothetical protein